jgi:hypothetical protein
MRNFKLLLIVSILSCALLFALQANGQSRGGAKKPINKVTKVKTLVNGKARTYYALEKDNPSVLRLNGPGKLKLYTRAHFANKNDKPAEYTIAYSINGGKEKLLKVSQEHPSSNSTYPEGVLGIPGQSKRFEIDLPIGANQIRFRLLENNKPVAVRYIFKPVNLKYNWITFAPREYEGVYEIVTNETVSCYYKFSKSNPLNVSVIGPTQVMVFTRLAFDQQMEGDVHYRLQVNENGKVVNTYQLSNRLSDVSIFKEMKNVTPGKASKIVINVPEGKHTYQISPMEDIKSGFYSKLMIIRNDVTNKD